MSSKFWNYSPLSEEQRAQRAEQERRPDPNTRSYQPAGREFVHEQDFTQGPWTNKPLSAEERARRANLSDKERQAEARAAREAYDDFIEESWHKSQKGSKKSTSYHQGAPTVTPGSSGNPAFFEGAFESKSARQQKQDQKAAGKQRRREQRQRARDAARKETERLKNLGKWEYLQMWWARDRAAYGTAFDEFEASAAEFIADNTKAFPKLAQHGCDRRNCVKGERLEVCHHEVEFTLRGSGCLSERSIKKERLRWHPDRWVGKGEVQETCGELFRLIQRVVDGEVAAS